MPFFSCPYSEKLTPSRMNYYVLHKKRGAGISCQSIHKWTGIVWNILSRHGMTEYIMAGNDATNSCSCLSHWESDGGLFIKSNSRNDNHRTVEYEYCRNGLSASLHRDWRLSGCHNWMEKEIMRFLKLWGRIMQTRVFWWLIHLWAKAGHQSQAALSAKATVRMGNKSGQTYSATFDISIKLKALRSMC